MQSCLSIIASVAVMFHMAFGCSWHHGFGNAHHCLNDCSVACCHHDNDAEDSQPDHDHGDQPCDHSGLDLAVNSDSNHAHGHTGCADDRCSVTQRIEFDFSPTDFDSPYLGGAECSALIGAGIQDGLGREPKPDQAIGVHYLAQGVRAHLLLNVQIL